MNRLKLNCMLTTAALIVAPSFAAEETNRTYREGMNLLLQERWGEARDYFQRFSQDFPDSAWRDDADYWYCYTGEQEQSETEAKFSCYEEFLQTWSESNWVNDAQERLVIMANQLASQGKPEFLKFAIQDMEDELVKAALVIENSAREGLRAAEVEIRNLSARNGAGLRTVEDQLMVVQDRLARNFRMVNEDQELLAFLSVLKDDPRAGELLIERFNNSDDPGLRARLVLMLEGMEGEQITAFLMDLARTEEDERVRRNAANALVDRNDPAAADLLRQIALSADYPVSTRVAIVSRTDQWAGNDALPFLSQIVTVSTEPRLVSAATEALLWMRTDAAEEVLVNAYSRIEDPALRHALLEKIDGWAAENMLGFLTEVAQTPGDERAAAIAIENIADIENNLAVVALDTIYHNTDNKQLHLAVIQGMGEARTEQSVDFLSGIAGDLADADYLSATARALGRTGLESAVAPVMTVYRSTDDVQVRREVMRALRRLEDFPQTRDFMVEVLEDQLEVIN